MARRKMAKTPPQPQKQRTRVLPAVLAGAVGVFAILWLMWPKSITTQPSTEFTDTRLPKVPFRLPPVHPLPEEPVNGADIPRRNAILDAFYTSWTAYREHAWGMDEYHPLSHHGSNLLGPKRAIGYTIVDSLDSLIIMGMDEEYRRAANWVRNIDWAIDGRLNVFEVRLHLPDDNPRARRSLVCRRTHN